MTMRREMWARSYWKRLIAAALLLMFGFSLYARATDERAVRSRVAPVYPEIAKRMKISGAVKLKVTVDADGKVTDVENVSGNHTLSVAAEDAVRRWKFAPGTGSSNVTVELNFELAQ